MILLYSVLHLDLLFCSIFFILLYLIAFYFLVQAWHLTFLFMLKYMWWREMKGLLIGFCGR